MDNVQGSRKRNVAMRISSLVIEHWPLVIYFPCHGDLVNSTAKRIALNSDSARGHHDATQHGVLDGGRRASDRDSECRGQADAHARRTASDGGDQETRRAGP